MPAPQVCCHKISWPGRFAGSSDTAVIPGDDGEPTSCPRCNGKVGSPNYLHTYTESNADDRVAVWDSIFSLVIPQRENLILTHVHPTLNAKRGKLGKYAEPRNVMTPTFPESEGRVAAVQSALFLKDPFPSSYA